MKSKIRSLQRTFSKHRFLRSKDLEKMGWQRWKIQDAVKRGQIERVARGLYALPDPELSEHQSFAQVTNAHPSVRICLLSALRFHNLTTQNPFEVWIAIGVKDRKPALTYPVLRVHRFSGPALTEGLEEHALLGTKIRVYSVPKTIVDLFRYRNKIGIDVAIEALKEGWREKRFTMDEINRLARLCRMSRVMGPYLETLVG